MVEMLITNAATLSIDLSTKDNDGFTDLHCACINGHANVVKIIMENASAFSIDLRRKDSFGSTAFHLACDMGFSDGVKIFMAMATNLSIDLNTKDANGMTGFHLACISGQSNVVKIVMDSEYSNHLEEKKYLSPSCIILASALKIDLNRIDNKGYTAFHYICQIGNSELVKMFMKNAAALKINLNMKNNDGLNALDLASRSGCTDVVNILMKDLEYESPQTNQGRSPMMLSAQSLLQSYSYREVREGWSTPEILEDN